ncbi:hypothetical protein [Pseudoalteromonas sp. '520P1 No. 423']
MTTEQLTKFKEYVIQNSIKPNGGRLIGKSLVYYIQDDFKKFKTEMFPEDHDRANIDICFQDEARFGQQNTTTRLWAEKGSRPRAVKQQQFQYANLFGAICPATGATEAIVTPK